MSSWRFANPPVWEAAVSAVTASSTVYDPYDIARIHKQFLPAFPRAERQGPILGLEPFTLGGPAPIGPPTIQFTPAADLNRWWFTSEDARQLVQVQENLISQNWRRTDLSPAPQQAYPHFEVLLSKFKKTIDTLSVYHESNERRMPSPRVGCVVYVNHLAMTNSDGSARKLREALPFLNFSDNVLKGNIATNWIETVPSSNGEDNPIRMAVSTNLIQIPGEGDTPTQMPFARLAFDARANCETWEGVYAIAEAAHSYMRQRLLDLTTPDLQATWQ